MLELTDSHPEFVVLDSEYRRLLGFPRDYEMAGHVRDLAEGARRWYAEHGDPWWYARHEGEVAVGDHGVTIRGTVFAANTLGVSMREAKADSTVLIAVSAGNDCEAEARRLWEEGKPDEYFFLEIFGSAVVEALVSAVAFRLCEWADLHHMAVLPHDSPGYPGWGIGEQRQLLDVIGVGGYPFHDRLEALPTGMLRPKKSLLAAFGVTRHRERVRRPTSLMPCERCSLAGCRYRRAAYRRPLPSVDAASTARSNVPKA